MKRSQNKMSLTIPARSINESFARYAVSTFAAQLDPSLEEIADIRTVVSEAVTNSIVHGYMESEGKIYISAEYYDDRSIKITVKDKGKGIDDIKKAMEPFYTGAPGTDRGGMGFTIMSSFTDKLSVRSVPNKGTTVTMIKKLKIKL
ncbi:MAG: anti-sigma F factor [Ruminococcaceae bacterium]|nr:anti-sigma F factor [Oscillospiraceae bacterium]